MATDQHDSMTFDKFLVPSFWQMTFDFFLLYRGQFPHTESTESAQLWKLAYVIIRHVDYNQNQKLV